jgi:hypothetical protein
VRRKAIGCASLCVLVVLGVVLGVVLVRVATRNRVEELGELPGVGGGLSTGLGPFAHEDRLLVLDRSSSRLQLLDRGLTVVDSVPAPADVNRLSASRDLSIVVALEYRGFSLINTRTKAQTWHTLDKMSTEAFVSPAGTHLWIGEYESGDIQFYELTNVDARRMRSANIKAEAERLIGPPRLIGTHDFRVVATADDGTATYLYSEAHEALLIYDWAAGRSVGTIPLPRLNSHPTFVPSPRGDRLAIVANRLVFVDLTQNAVLVDRELNDYSRAGDFSPEGDRFFVAYSAPAMLPIPFTNRGGQIDAFDLQGNRLKTWHSEADRIREFGARGSVTWMATDDGLLQTIRLP